MSIKNKINQLIQANQQEAAVTTEKMTEKELRATFGSMYCPDRGREVKSTGFSESWALSQKKDFSNFIKSNFVPTLEAAPRVVGKEGYMTEEQYAAALEKLYNELKVLFEGDTADTKTKAKKAPALK